MSARNEHESSEMLLHAAHESRAVPPPPPVPSLADSESLLTGVGSIRLTGSESECGCPSYHFGAKTVLEQQLPDRFAKLYTQVSGSRELVACKSWRSIVPNPD